MSKFYVGQRVRVKWTLHYPEYVGREGVIVEGPCEYFDPIDCEIYEGYTLDFDEEFGASGDQLEPLTDPGREVVSWETCEWKPPHLREVTA